MPHEHGSQNGIATSSLFYWRLPRQRPEGGSRAKSAHVTQPSLSGQIWVLEDEVGAQLLTRGTRIGIELTPERRYVKLGFGGAHTDSNQRLMYTSA
jgi:hypothetical protein